MTITFEEYRRRCGSCRRELVEHLGFDSEADFARIAKVDQPSISRLLGGGYVTGVSDNLAVKLCIAISATNAEKAMSFSKAANELINALWHIWRHSSIWYSNVDLSTVPSKFCIRVTGEVIESFSPDSGMEREAVIERWRLKLTNSLEQYHERRLPPLVSFETYEEMQECIRQLISKWSMPYVFDQYNKVEAAVKSNLGTVDSFFKEAIKRKLYGDVEEIFIAISYSLYLCGAVDTIRTVSGWLMKTASRHNGESLTTYYFAKACITWIQSSSISPCDVDESEALVREIWTDFSHESVLRRVDTRVVAMVCELVLRIHNRFLIAGNESRSHVIFQDLYQQAEQMLMGVLEDSSRPHISGRVRERFMIPLEYQLALNFCVRGSRANSIELLDSASDIYFDLFDRSTEIGWQRVSNALLTWQATVALMKGDSDLSRAVLSRATALNKKRMSTCEQILRSIDDGKFYLF